MKQIVLAMAVAALLLSGCASAPERPPNKTTSAQAAALYEKLGEDTRIMESAAYWGGSARPFSITQYTLTAGGEAALVLQNNLPKPATISRLSVGNATYSVPSEFMPGEEKSFSIKGGPSGKAGSLYSLSVSIDYSLQNTGMATQVGEESLVGRYK